MEIEIPGRLPKPSFDESQFVWNDNPTQQIVDEITAENRYVLSIVECPDGSIPISGEEVQAFINRFLEENNLRPDTRHFIWPFVELSFLDKEVFRESIMEDLKRFWTDFDLNRGMFRPGYASSSQFLPFTIGETK